MPKSSDVRYAFMLGRISITVCHRVDEAPEGDLHGGLLEIQRTYEETGGEFETTVATLREPIWRVDLCRWDEGPPGNWERAHHHNRWDGMEPFERQFDPGLTLDPVSWVEQQLMDIDCILRNGGAADLVGTVTQDQVEEVRPWIMSILRHCMKQELTGDFTMS